MPEIDWTDQAKIQTNWRIIKSVKLKLDQVRVIKGFSSTPALVNNLLKRLAMGETVKL